MNRRLRRRGRRDPVGIVETGGQWALNDAAGCRPIPLHPATPLPTGGSLAPSVLVGGESGMVPFLDYGGVLTDLVRWLRADEPGGLRALTGPAGTGKTRTVRALCREAQRSGWLAGLLAEDAGTAGMSELAQAPTALLVVLEDADLRVGQLTALVPLLADRVRRGLPARLLLTLRDRAHLVRWLDSRCLFEEQGAHWLASGHFYDMEERAPDRLARRSLYDRAAQVLAAHLGLAGPDRSDLAERATETFGDPLLIVMCAYLGVHGEAAPQSPRELLDRFFEDHEDPYWERLGGGDLLGDRSVRRQVATLVAVTGARDDREANHLLSLLGGSIAGEEEQRVELARWGSRLRPGPRYWNSAPRGLLTEHLLATTWGADPQVLDHLLSQPPDDSLARSVGLAARAAAGSATLATALIPLVERRLRTLCDRARSDADLAVALAELVGVCPPQAADALGVLDALPSRSVLGIRLLALALNEKVEAHFRGLTDRGSEGGQSGLAVALNNLSVRLADIGRPRDAVAAAAESTAIYRQLAEADPRTHRPDLAISLYNLSLRLADVGQTAAAVSGGAEAVGLLRTLAAVEPATFEPRLADALHHQARHLASVGRNDESAAAANEAVALYRSLSEDDPDPFRPQLAAAVVDLSARLAEVGRREDAAAAAREGVGGFRRLAAAYPEVYRSQLAAALDGLSRRLVALGRRQPARAAITEAVGHYRDLAQVSPSYRPDLARALETLAAQLSDLGLVREAAARRAEAGRLAHDPTGRSMTPPRTLATPIPVVAQLQKSQQ